MADKKSESLQALRHFSEELDKTQANMARAFEEAANARATAQELSNATRLSVVQVRYYASKNNIKLAADRRGPKVH